MKTHWTDKYVGVPFVEDGATFKGCNCWGLIRLVYYCEAQILLPEYAIQADDLRATVREIANNKGYGDWPHAVPLGQEVALDVVTMRSVRSEYEGKVAVIENHLGVIAWRGMILHVEREANTVLLPLKHWSVAP
ncbi:MAG: hypothetical protein MN733_02655, partial [Nitrososphaera sp.]|nr:hypothetical protein [Nitrososphaera sp.]